MSFINRLINRKGQQKKESTLVKKSLHFNMDEEDPEDDEDGADKAAETEASGDNSEAQETFEVLEREIHPAKIICPDCGGVTLEGLEFCDKCGGELL